MKIKKRSRFLALFDSSTCLDHLLHLYGPSVIAKKQISDQSTTAGRDEHVVKAGFDNNAFVEEVTSYYFCRVFICGESLKRTSSRIPLYFSSHSQFQVRHAWIMKLCISFGFREISQLENKCSDSSMELPVLLLRNYDLPTTNQPKDS